MKKKRFVIYGAMRTGSNYLVSLLNQFPDIVCHGEVFNPGFVGLREDYHERFGIARHETEKRDVDEGSFYSRLMALESSSQVIGLKLFPEHSKYALATTLSDPEVAKIVLRRDVLTSFISLCQAEQTGIWMIRGGSREQVAEIMRKSDIKILFDGPRYLRYRALVFGFYREIEDALQSSGQEYLRLWYKDLACKNISNRLLGFLGSETTQGQAGGDLLAKQNISPPHDRVLNLREMVEFLGSRGINNAFVKTAKKALEMAE